MVKAKKNKITSKKNISKKRKLLEIIEGIVILIFTFAVVYIAAYFQALVSAGISLAFLIILLAYLIIRYKLKKRK